MATPPPFRGAALLSPTQPDDSFTHARLHPMTTRVVLPDAHFYQPNSRPPRATPDQRANYYRPFVVRARLENQSQGQGVTFQPIIAGEKATHYGNGEAAMRELRRYNEETARLTGQRRPTSRPERYVQGYHFHDD